MSYYSDHENAVRKAVLGKETREPIARILEKDDSDALYVKTAALLDLNTLEQKQAERVVSIQAVNLSPYQSDNTENVYYSLNIVRASQS